MARSGIETLLTMVLFAVAGCALVDGLSGDKEPPGGCVVVETNCIDGFDDDCNNATDCDDPACTSRPECGGGGCPRIIAPETDDFTINSCQEAAPLFFGGSCGPNFGDDGVVIELPVANPGVYSICTEAPTDNFFLATSCNPDGDDIVTCLPFDGNCVTVFLDAGVFFVVHRNSPACGNVDLALGLASEIGLLCQNGLDDDNDGLVDCEDPDCQTDPSCGPGPPPPSPDGGV